MRLIRFLCVLLLLTGLGVVLGAAAGALIGVAVPEKVTVHGESSPDANRPDVHQGTVTLAHEANRTPIQSGAALGAGFGLMAGVVAGLALGVLDQLLLAMREAAQRKTELNTDG